MSAASAQHERAAELGISLIGTVRDNELPVVNGPEAGFVAIETLAIELAEVFGVSIPFTHVRLRKYGPTTAL